MYNGGTATIKKTQILGNRFDEGNVTTLVGEGGGIFNADKSPAATVLEVEASYLFENAAANGGGILNQATRNLNKPMVHIAYSTFKSNAAYYGGGFYSDSSTHPQSPSAATILDSTFDSNTAQFDGGAIHTDVSAAITVLNSTFYGNEVTLYGGAILTFKGADLVIKSCTIYQNMATDTESVGGGIYIAAGGAGSGVKLVNTILLGNIAILGPNGFAFDNTSFNSLGHNLFGDISGMLLVAAMGDQVNVTPTQAKLGPLQDNGGVPQLPYPFHPKTVALESGSPAIDMGDNTQIPTPRRPYDERGPGYARIVNGTIDIGAFEVQQPPTAVATLGSGLFPDNPAGAGSHEQLAAAGTASEQRPPLLHVGLTAAEGPLSGDALSSGEGSPWRVPHPTEPSTPVEGTIEPIEDLILGNLALPWQTGGLGDS